MFIGILLTRGVQFLLEINKIKIRKKFYQFMENEIIYTKIDKFFFKKFI